MEIIRAIAFKGTLLAGFLLIGASAFALPITGDLGFSGTRLFSFTIPSGINTGSYIDFQLPVDGGNGSMDSDGTTGFFNIVPNNDPGFIKDLATAPNSLGYSVAPVGATVSIDNFLAFSSLPTTNLRLTQLPFATSCIPGPFVACVGAFQLVQNGPHVSLSMSIIGEALNGPDTSPWTGQMTAQFLNTSIQNVIAGASSPTGTLANSWNGAITASGSALPIPEPGTVALISIGIIAKMLGGLRTKQQRSS